MPFWKKLVNAVVGVTVGSGLIGGGWVIVNQVTTSTSKNNGSAETCQPRLDASAEGVAMPDAWAKAVAAWKNEVHTTYDIPLNKTYSDWLKSRNKKSVVSSCKIVSVWPLKSSCTASAEPCP